MAITWSSITLIITNSGCLSVHYARGWYIIVPLGFATSRELHDLQLAFSCQEFLCCMSRALPSQFDNLRDYNCFALIGEANIEGQ